MKFKFKIGDKVILSKSSLIMYEDNDEDYNEAKSLIAKIILREEVIGYHNEYLIRFEDGIQITCLETELSLFKEKQWNEESL